MELFGNIVVYVIMLCAIVGALASIFREQSELGQQFLSGFQSIGTIFLPIAGIMAASPYLTLLVSNVFGPIFSTLGADPAMAATTFIAVDMGGYQLAEALAQTRESWIMAMMTGYMAGPTIVFCIPVALKILRPEDRKYLALGVMSGFVSIPFGVLVSSLIIAFSNPVIREAVSTNSAASYQLALGFAEIVHNMIPLIIICSLLALGLFFAPRQMTCGFNIFGKLLDSVLRLVVVLSVVEYFTGIFSALLGHWEFAPILADHADVNRALEVAGTIGMMLCGAFPMVYLIRTYLAKPLNRIGKRIGLSEDATAGILACSANALALFKMVEDMNPEDKVRTLAFSVCGAFLLGDHLAFTANYQPTLILPVLCGKIAAAILSVCIANLLLSSKIMKKTLGTPTVQSGIRSAS